MLAADKSADEIRWMRCQADTPLVAENDEISLVIRRTSSVPGPGSLSSGYVIASRKLFDLMNPGVCGLGSPHFPSGRMCTSGQVQKRTEVYFCLEPAERERLVPGVNIHVGAEVEVVWPWVS